MESLQYSPFCPLNNVRQNIKVLVAPLDWGLGHATRCIPLIQSLLAAGYEVLLAGEGKQAALLAAEFPQLTLLPLRGYRVTYSRRAWQLPFTLLGQLPAIWRTIRAENRWLREQVRQHNIQLVISDNRYGLYHPDIPCAMLTHQLTIAVPIRILQNLLQQFHYRLLNRFSIVWVPDLAGSVNAAGLLSHPETMPKVPVQYIGWLSRFHAADKLPTYKYCVLLSGPEPQRTILEEKLLSSFNKIHEKVLFIRGLPGEEDLPITGKHIVCYNHLKEADLQTALQEAEWVISRSGYTTVMELLTLQKKSILLPTPGQTEQAYLAKRLPALGWAFSADQENLQLEKVLKAAENFSFQTPPAGSFESDKWLAEVKRLLSL